MLNTDIFHLFQENLSGVSDLLVYIGQNNTAYVCNEKF
jgi:hypothetical protein